MAWVTWRQHRLALAGVLAVFGVASAYLLITGLQLYSDYAAVSSCRPAASALCRQATNDFLGAHAPDAGITFALLHVIPALIGAFVGAPVLAREFETGTFRYAWTQGFGRVRWTIAKLIPLAIVVTRFILLYVAIAYFANADAKSTVLLMAAVLILLIGAADVSWEMLVLVSDDRERS